MASDEHIERLNRVLMRLEQKIARQNSLKNAFKRGLLYGFGIVLGATILAGLTLSILSIVFKDVPIVGDVIEQIPE